MKDNVGVFCDVNLSDYEKTMYGMAIAFSEIGAFVIKDEDIPELSARFCLEEGLLRKALSFCPDGYIPYGIIKMGDELIKEEQFSNADLFNALVRVYYIYKNLSRISDGVSYESILNNFQLLQDSICEFEILNMLTATFECMRNDCYSKNYAVFNNSSYQPRNQLNLLQLGLTEDYDVILDKSFLPFLCRIMSYELIARVNSVYLITINQVIKHSPYFDEKMQSVASEMYYYLLSLAQNARVISIQTNYLPPLRSDEPEDRGRRDNTTRLQVLYGYENFDTYYLRLDLAHKGQGFIHYNNKSPGGIKCCLFDEEEYRIILSKWPTAESFFVDYDGRFALKEPHNLELSGDEITIYEAIRKQKEHAQAFEGTYDEESVVTFINVISSMLPAYCNVCLDTEEDHARNCFQYEKIMFYSVLLEMAILSKKEESINKGLAIITELAVKYGIITHDATDQYANIEGVCLIIDEAKNKVAMLQDA